AALDAAAPATAAQRGARVSGLTALPNRLAVGEARRHRATPWGRAMTASVAAATSTPVRSFRPSIFFCMTLAMCLFVFAGCGIPSFLPALRGDFPPAPPIVHLHGAVFVAWMLLLLLPSALVCSGNVRLHRALGTWGI